LFSWECLGSNSTPRCICTKNYRCKNCKYKNYRCYTCV
jgi:hypothetical protein